MYMYMYMHMYMYLDVPCDVVLSNESSIEGLVPAGLVG